MRWIAASYPGSGCAWMDGRMDGRERGFRRTVASKRQRGGEAPIPEAKFPGRAPRTACIPQKPIFRNQTGTCLTKINPAPTIYFSPYFCSAEAGRATGAPGRFARFPPGSRLRMPTGPPPGRGGRGRERGVGSESKHAGSGSRGPFLRLSDIHPGLPGPSEFLVHGDKQAFRRWDSNHQGQRSQWQARRDTFPSCGGTHGPDQGDSVSTNSNAL